MVDKYAGIIRVDPPLRSDIKIIRVLICCGVVAMFIFVKWFIQPQHIGHTIIYSLLTFALGFKLLKMIHEWYHYWNPAVLKRPEITREWKVDVLTTFCPGEPKEMMINTLKAMKAITYPHTNYLCDEGDDPVLKKFCSEMGIIHVTRIKKIDAKAGNINNALQSASGDICVVLDPDHEPVPEFIDRVLPYFEDDSVGFVQCVQAYKNQEESFIAKGAAEQTYHFYGPMMMCMNSYGTVQAIGANCTFRRSALDSIGGHAAGLSEDMHTSMQLHAKGWKSVYVPEILTRGLVPATMSSYYAQQLKWSRGTFELLFRTFPQLYKNFTWRQRIHYFTIPLYFLFGLINLIDIAIPMLALGMAEVPWEVNLLYFGMYFFPLCALSMLTRFYAQRWLLEKHERGFHFAGGILRMATWWIFLIGFIYTIFKIRVPYIPTPKEDEHQNYFKLSIPNLIVLLATFFFVLYGLSIDWTPYSIAMAFYALLTAGVLGFTIMMSQQKLLLSLHSFCGRIPALNLMSHLTGSFFRESQQLSYRFLSNGPVVLIIAFSMIFLSYINVDVLPGDSKNVVNKEFGGFYLGLTLGNDADIDRVNEVDKQIDGPLNVVSFEQSWNESGEPFSYTLINKCRERGSVPCIAWSIKESKDPENSKCTNILKGAYNPYLKKCAAFFRDYKDPLFLNFSVVANNGDQLSPGQFVKTWQYLYTFFNNLGISNITWVWRPANSNDTLSYPGEKFVDWIGVECMNYAEDPKEKDWYAFSEIYAPYRKNLGRFQKPVMIMNLGCAFGQGQEDWYTAAFADIKNKYHEVRSAVICNSEKKIYSVLDNGDSSLYLADFNFNSNTYRAIDLQLQNEPFKDRHLIASGRRFENMQQDYKSAFVKGRPGNFQLIVNGNPYYIRGIAYNTAHDWRDGNMPLTRRQVFRDFKKIKEMGANTIRRYGHGIYDSNVLNIAHEFNLNVMYGFWFDPKIDFYRDSAKVEAYIKEVEENVLQYKDHPAVIAWSLGNESWGLLKHQYAKPYLTKVRDAYVQMIEHLAQRIHQLDPKRPVFSCMEHEEYQLAGELVAFKDGAPSLDIIGVNSYYKEQVSKLNHIVWQFDSLRPYLVSEFGPRGYWDPKYNKIAGQSVIEETDAEKSLWYKTQWEAYIKGYKGYNVGGFAYCWHDRMEGSYTWFGITDYKGRPKPAYFALKALWMKEKQESFPVFSIKSPALFIPGNTYTYTAVPDKEIKSELNYEWRLLKDEYLEEVDNIEEGEDLASVRITIPQEPSDYRLYLFVTDKKEQRVTTASVPIKVSQRKLQ